MTKLSSFVFCLTLMFSSCIDNASRQSTRNSSNFQTFEISFTNGWTRGFSFLVDTSKGFIASTKRDTIQFGVLPDTIFKLIDTTLLKLKNDTTIKTKEISCVDCSLISIKAVFQNETIRIFQSSSDINKIFIPIIKRLQIFLDSSQHTKISAFNWETQRQILPPPVLPPILDKIKFKLPKRH